MEQYKPFEPMMYKHCVACNSGTMEATPRLLPQYEDVYYCKCDNCGYIDASCFYENLKDLTKTDLFKPKPNADELQTPK
jgi:hypothetical protein